MDASLILAITALVLSLFALGGTSLALLRAERKTVLDLKRAVIECQADNAALMDQYKSLLGTMKRINSRSAMRERRAQNGTDAATPDPKVDPDEWKRQMMLKFPRGALSAGGQ